MQALSLAVHIPIVCFGIAFPAMILFVHGLYLRTGEPHFKALAKRWSKVALTLFAVGVVTGTILSFEFGLLWPDFSATFGEVYGVAFGLEGVAFFLEAIFIAIYVYGWDRLPRRTHFLTGIPIVITGFVRLVLRHRRQRLDERPDRLRRPRRRGGRPGAVDRAAQREHVARADPHVPGRLRRRGLHRGRRVRHGPPARQARRVPPHRPGRGAQLRRAGRARAGHHRRLGRARGDRAPADQARRDRGARRARRRARRSRSAAGTTPATTR